MKDAPFSYSHPSSCMMDWEWLPLAPSALNILQLYGKIISYKYLVVNSKNTKHLRFARSVQNIRLVLFFCHPSRVLSINSLMPRIWWGERDLNPQSRPTPDLQSGPLPVTVYLPIVATPVLVKLYTVCQCTRIKNLEECHVEPIARFELATYGLQIRCSTN